LGECLSHGKLSRQAASNMLPGVFFDYRSAAQATQIDTWIQNPSDF
jgi:hypothetical protein